jgi:hypothetical protein
MTTGLRSGVSFLGAVAVLASAGAANAAETAARVDVVSRPAERRVDVTVDGQPFTAYIWPDRLAKPVLYPIRTAKGSLVTRGFPLDPRLGERVDHPHQVGMWLNHGDVNGADFWNNSEALTPEERAKRGAIRHREVVAAKGGTGRGTLDVRAEWVLPGETVALSEETRFVFGAAGATRTIDRRTTLTAAGGPVTFADSKEGMLAIRVARALEQPADKPEVFTDAAGKPTAVPVLDNAGVSGLYTSSEGLTGDAVWGTRARWMALAGRLGSEDVVLVILDHPKNPDFPTRWHARGYGLFAANPFGQGAYTNGKEAPSRFTIAAGARAVLRHRLAILPGPFSAAAAETAWKAFVAEPLD